MTDTDDGGDPEYDVDFRENPEAYEIGRGEQGVSKVQPYKDELLPPWTIETLEGAEESAESILERYEEYSEANDVPGMDVARRYLQMGYTRSMRYAKYPGGRKYEDGEEREPEEWADPEKREIALRLERVRGDETYRRAKESHRDQRKSR